MTSMNFFGFFPSLIPVTDLQSTSDFLLSDGKVLEREQVL